MASFSASRAWAGLPAPVRVEVSAEKGRRLVATRAWAVGQVVFTEQPVAVVMHDCDFASVGEETVYPELGEIASRFSVSCDLLKMVLRLYLFLQQKDEHTGGTGEQQALFSAIVEGGAVRGTAAAILMLEAHLAKQDTRWTSAVTAAAQALAPLVLPLAAPGSSPRLEDTQELLVALAARVNVNAYGILHPGDPPSRPRGFCMLPVVGLTINHSCDPNCAYVFDPRSGCMQYRSTRAIAASEELTVSYVDTLEDTHARRAVLLASKHFWCGCARCAGMDEVEARVRRGEAWDLLAEDLLGLDLDAPPAGGGKKGKGGKGGGKSGGGGGGGGPPGLSRALQLADAQLGGLSCPQCPPGCGVIIGFAAYPASPAPGVPKARAGCLLCGLQVPLADAEASLQRHAAGWQQQQQLQRGGGGGAAAEACEAVERWLQGADPLSAAGAKAPAARRRGPLSLQLHPNHALLLEAHVKLASLCLQLQQQQQQQQQQHAGAAGKAVQALQRAARMTAGIVGGDHHPELLSLLGHLGDALALAATPQSLRERADVLERVRKARVLAFGADADDN